TIVSILRSTSGCCFCQSFAAASCQRRSGNSQTAMASGVLAPPDAAGAAACGAAPAACVGAAAAPPAAAGAAVGAAEAPELAGAVVGAGAAALGASVGAGALPPHAASAAAAAESARPPSRRRRVKSVRAMRRFLPCRRACLDVRQVHDRLAGVLAGLHTLIEGDLAVEQRRGGVRPLV